MKTIELQSYAGKLGAVRFLDEAFKKVVLQKLKGLKFGRLVIEDKTDGSVHEFGDAASEVFAQIVVRNQGFYKRVALEGSIGAGESYAEGFWDCAQLADMIRIFARNMDVVGGVDSGLGAVFSPVMKLAHRMKSNNKANARKNIYAHYDLGNDFFKLFLDPTMMYSCAIFPSESSTLEEASIHKNDLICQKLGLKPDDEVIEIGTGWGSFAIHAAKNYGCRVTTTTISKSQHDYAVEQVSKHGLEDKIKILFMDYRDLTGKFDKLVSIEMIEAVGLDHLDVYFKKCSSLLKDDGKMLIQAILIRDQQYEYAKNSVDFIKKCIFPGSGIPSVKSIVDAVAENTDMRLFNQADYSGHYARTLSIWMKNLNSNYEKIMRLGYPESLLRLWQFYLAYCEGGFAERNIGSVHMEFQKPLCR